MIDTNPDMACYIRINEKVISGDCKPSGETRYAHLSYRTAQALEMYTGWTMTIGRLAPKAARSR
jgi:hypothetical protein